METKLTYENMYKLVSDYFQNFEGVPDAGLEDGKASVAKYFSKDLITRRRCWPSLTNLDEWMAVLVDNYPNHRYDINIDKPCASIRKAGCAASRCARMCMDYSTELEASVSV